MLHEGLSLRQTVVHPQRNAWARPWLGILSKTPEPHIACCFIFVHPLFSCLNPIFKNTGLLSVVAF